MGQEAKPWYASKTLWFNLASAALAAVILVEDYLRASFLPVSDGLRPWLIMVLAIANIFLRYATSQPIAGSPAARR